MTEVSDAEETIPKALLLLNGSLFNGVTRLTPGLSLVTILKSSDDDYACLEQLYLRTLSRKPTTTELAAWKKYLSKTRTVVHTPGPPTGVKTGLASLTADKMIMEAPANADFKELVDRANSAADFTALYKRMKNNADGALFVKAFEAYSAEAPFQHMATQPGGNTTREQAYENIYWALVNCTEFLSNH